MTINAFPATMSPQQLADHLDVPVRSVTHVIRSRRITASGKQGKCRVFDRTAVLAILEGLLATQRRHKASAKDALSAIEAARLRIHPQAKLRRHLQKLYDLVFKDWQCAPRLAARLLNHLEREDRRLFRILHPGEAQFDLTDEQRAEIREGADGEERLEQLEGTTPLEHCRPQLDASTWKPDELSDALKMSHKLAMTFSNREGLPSYLKKLTADVHLVLIDEVCRRLSQK